MTTPIDDAGVPARLMADPDLAAPEIDDVEGASLTEDPTHPSLPGS